MVGGHGKVKLNIKRRHVLLTLSLDGGVWSALRSGRFIPREEIPPVPIEQKAGWAPQFTMTLWSRAEFFSLLRNE
jgi:hypothetical protein